MQRVVVGDLEHVLAGPDSLGWVESVRIFASLVIDSGWGVPVIAYATTEKLDAHPAAVLSAYADLQINASHPMQAHLAARWRRKSWVLNFQEDATNVHMPLDTLPRPPGRRIDH